jgi:uncharacterized membrane protein
VVAVVVLMTTLDVDVFTRAEIAFVVGGVVAVVWMGIASLVAVRGLVPGYAEGRV